jgi:hypothetical protein
MREIYVFIVENEVLAKGLISEHFKADQITYANMLPAALRPAIVGAIEQTEEDNQKV